MNNTVASNSEYTIHNRNIFDQKSATDAEPIWYTLGRAIMPQLGKINCKHSTNTGSSTVITGNRIVQPGINSREQMSFASMIEPSLNEIMGERIDITIAVTNSTTKNKTNQITRRSNILEIERNLKFTIPDK